MRDFHQKGAVTSVTVHRPSHPEMTVDRATDRSRWWLVAACLAAFAGSAVMVAYLWLDPPSKALLAVSFVFSAAGAACAFRLLVPRTAA